VTKASDNEFPSLLIKEGTAPASPASGDQRVYIDSADHHLKRKNSSGTVTDLEGGTAAAYVTAHGARVIRSANLSVGNNVYTVLAFTAEDFDTDAMHDNTTNNSRLIIPTITGVTTGLWHVTSFGYTDQLSQNARQDCAIRLNAAGNPASGTLIAFGSIPNIAAANLVLGAYGAACDYVFTAGDYVETFVRTTGGTFNAVFDAGASPVFSISFLGKVT